MRFQNSLDNRYSFHSFLKDCLCALIVAVVLFGIIFNLVFVNGSSMEPTFHDGNLILANHIAPKLEYGSVVVCDADGLGARIIKRVIGCPGDTVDIDYNEGIVYLNGEALDEPYAAERTYAFPDENATELPVTLGEDCYFVLGDNRNHSVDSRFQEVGVIHRSDIVASYICTIF